MAEKIAKIKIITEDLSSGAVTKIVNRFEQLIGTTKRVTTETEEYKKKGDRLTLTTKDIYDSVTKVNKPMSALGKRLNILQDVAVNTKLPLAKVKESMKGLATGSLAFKRQLKDLTDTYIPRFEMHWLGIMFGGMAIQRVFGRVQRAAVKTFTDVMATVKGASTNVGKLTAHFNYLKFTIGSAIDNAIAPFMPLIIRLTNAFANFAEQHPEVVFGAISGMFAVGTALAVGGSFYLFANSMTALAGLPNFTKMGGLPGILKKIGAAVLAHPAIAALAAALVIIGGIVWTAFNKTPEAWEAIKKHAGGLSEPMNDLADVLVDLVNTIFPSLNIAWEGFAWSASWAISSIVDLTASAIAGLARMVKFMEVVILNFKRMWAAITKRDYAEAEKNALAAYADYAELVEKSEGLPGLSTLFGGVSAFREKEEAYQNRLEVPSLNVDAGGEPVSRANAVNYYVNVDMTNKERLIDDLMRHIV